MGPGGRSTLTEPARRAGRCPKVTATCPGCGRDLDRALLAQARRHAFWTRPDGSCPACAQQELLATLLTAGEAHFADSVQTSWPLDARAVGPLPTPLRLRADPRFLGRGITMAIADSGFAAHPDLVSPSNRVLAWVDATTDPVRVLRFSRDGVPEWPGSGGSADHLWHGTMTAVVAAGNGWRSDGLYRGLAAEADLVLIHLTGGDGRIADGSIERALSWLAEHGADYRVRVVSLSVAADAAPSALGSIDRWVEQLVERGITVVAAAGNDGIRRLVPPATAPSAVTVGGLDDQGGIDAGGRSLWRGNFGDSALGLPKPELVAPSIWVVAPILPGTDASRQARDLFDRRQAGDPSCLDEIRARKFVTDHYQHADGTSFAAPIVASTVATMLEANSTLTPRLVREALLRAAWPVPGADVERQGAGAIDAGRAVAHALLERHRWHEPAPIGPLKTARGLVFSLHDHGAASVAVHGAWDGWAAPHPFRQVESGLWTSDPLPVAAGRHAYKFLLDGQTWIPDPANPHRRSDGRGGINSIVQWP